MRTGGAGGLARNVDAEGFWRFSLAFYARPRVAPALIGLQDRAGLDVNIVLFAIWLGLAEGRTLDAEALAAAEAAAAPVRDAVVTELRGLRRRLRPSPEPDIQALRRQVQVLEIAAERAVQARLAATLRAGKEGGADRESVAAGNLTLVLGAASASQEAAEIRRALAAFIRRR